MTLERGKDFLRWSSRTTRRSWPGTGRRTPSQPMLHETPGTRCAGEGAGMNWEQRCREMILAGGALAAAACASNGRTGDNGEAGSSDGSSDVGVGPGDGDTGDAPSSVAYDSSFQVPCCNANGDPCCPSCYCGGGAYEPCCSYCGNPQWGNPQWSVCLQQETACRSDGGAFDLSSAGDGGTQASCLASLPREAGPGDAGIDGDGHD